MWNQPITWGNLIVITLVILVVWFVLDVVVYCVKYWRHPPRQ